MPGFLDSERANCKLLNLHCCHTRKGLLLVVTHRDMDDCAVPCSMLSMHSMQHDALIVTVHICLASSSRNHLCLWGWLSQGLQQQPGAAVLLLLGVWQGNTGVLQAPNCAESSTAPGGPTTATQPIVSYPVLTHSLPAHPLMPRIATSNVSIEAEEKIKPD